MTAAPFATRRRFLARAARTAVVSGFAAAATIAGGGTVAASIASGPDRKRDAIRSAVAEYHAASAGAAGRDADYRDDPCRATDAALADANDRLADSITALNRAIRSAGLLGAFVGGRLYLADGSSRRDEGEWQFGLDAKKIADLG